MDQFICRNRHQAEVCNNESNSLARRCLSVAGWEQCCQLVAKFHSLISEALLRRKKLFDKVFRRLTDWHRVNDGLVAAPFPAFGLLYKFSATFIDQFPGINLYLSTNNWQDLHRALLEREIELFVADIRELVDDSRLKVLELPRLQGMICCRSGHPLTEKPNLHWQDILKYPLAMPRLPKYFEYYLHTLSQPHGGLNRRIECDNIAMLMSLVAGSNALSMAPELMLQDKLTAGELVQLAVEGLENFHTNFGVVHRADQQLSPAATAYISLIVNQIQPNDTVC